MKVSPYIFFNGKCEEALNYYAKLLGANLEFITRYSDLPPNSGFNIPEDMKNHIMHGSLKVGNDYIFASDSGPWGKASSGSFSITLCFDTEEEIDRVYKEFSREGVVLMPLEVTFWGSKYCKLQDKYGITWDLNFPLNRD